MRATDRAASGAGVYILNRQRDAQLVQLCHELNDTFLADARGVIQYCAQIWIVPRIAEQVGEHVKFLRVDAAGDFDAGNDFEAEFLAGRQRFGDCVERIVVGDGNRGEAKLDGVLDEFTWRKGAVGVARVQMQIREARWIRGRSHCADVAVREGRVRSAFRRSRIPLTNAPDSRVENLFAMSTASLMLTTGGMSSRNSISYIASLRMLRSTAAMRGKSQLSVYFAIRSSMATRCSTTP